MKVPARKNLLATAMKINLLATAMAMTLSLALRVCQLRVCAAHDAAWAALYGKTDG